jgi:hypothetical protein
MIAHEYEATAHDKARGSAVDRERARLLATGNYGARR